MCVVQLLVMRLRFFKIVWHDITLLIVLVGLCDLLVINFVSGDRGPMLRQDITGRIFIRLAFIFSRLIRLLGMVETVPVGDVVLSIVIVVDLLFKSS